MGDITETLAPKSDQLDAVDLLGGPRIFTVQETVVRDGAEQPVSIRLAEFPRVWRPGKNMRRVLAAGWGPQSKAWPGRQVELYCDPSVVFGGQAVGGTRIRAMSHLPDGKPLKVPLLISKGKTAIYTVQPLKDAPAPKATPAPTAEDVAATDDTEQLRAMWHAADQDVRNLIEARVAEINSKPADVDPFDQDGADQ